MTFTGHTSDVNSLAVLSDEYLASDSRETKIKIWDTVKGIEIKTHTGPKNSVLS